MLSDYLCCLREWEEQYAPHTAEEEWHPLFCEALEKTMEKMEKAEQAEQTAQLETWFDGRKVNDVLFCEDFLAGHPMKCIHGRFFDIKGQSAIRSRLRQRYTT